uniref:Uncharacterized protein n=1 Tax=Rhizophora mucronata TaxID=61149 RepID=A0A2P2Q4B8_RHIMU
MLLSHFFFTCSVVSILLYTSISFNVLKVANLPRMIYRLYLHTYSVALLWTIDIEIVLNSTYLSLLSAKI